VLDVDNVAWNAENPVPDVDVPMLDVDIFWLLDLAVTRKLIEKTNIEKAFCDCCETIHFHQWFKNKRTEDCFYICTVKKAAVLKYKSGNRGQLSLPDLINQIF